MIYFYQVKKRKGESVVPAKETEAMIKIRQMSAKEKIQMLTESDKDYLRGYIDRATLETNKPKRRSKVTGTK